MAPEAINEAVLNKLKNESNNSFIVKEKVNESELEEFNKNLDAPVAEDGIHGDFI